MTLFQGLSAFPMTPVDPSGKIDVAALVRMLSHIQEAGADSIGLLGSTGAYAFLSRDQRRRVLDIAMEAVGGRVPVIVGVGALRTDEAENHAADAKAAGADGLLLAPVSYTPLTDEEVYQHFAAVSEAGQLPLCIYNNPGTTRFAFSIGLIERLAGLPNVAAMKMPLPAGGDFAAELAALRSRIPSTFAIGYSGDWGASDALLAGADAWYSVVAGLLPKQAVALARAAKGGDVEQAKGIDAAFGPIWSLFKEFGSFRVVYALAEVLGHGSFSPPRPVLGLSPDARGRLRQAVEGLNAFL